MVEEAKAILLPGIRRGNLMKCVNCGAKIKDGSIYCPVCGKEAQVVNGYVSLEDDFLHALIRDSVNATDNSRNNKKNLTQNKKAGLFANKQQMPIIITCILLVCCIAIGIVIKVSVDNRNHNSYEYQVKMAKQEMIDHNYESALQYYSRALALRPTDIACRMELADIYSIYEDDHAEAVLLQEVVQLDNDNITAYERLIDIYYKNKQYEQIRSLSAYAKEPKVQKLFEGYLVNEPGVYPEGGRHNTAITITMVSVEDKPIYYTLDGSDPMENGILYVRKIDVNQSGDYHIRAVCKNIDTGVYSKEIEKKYEVIIVAPDVPSAYPTGGSIFTEPTHIRMYAQEDCSIYYTWDGTRPTKESAKYTEPILIPEGEHILSAIVINDRTGLMSEVMQESYTYIAEAE